MTPPLRKNRDFVLLQTGQLLSNVGTGTATIAYPLLVLAATGSPAKTGLVSFAQFLPYVLFGLAAGVAADRWNRKRLMVAADVVRAAAVATLAAAVAAGHVALWHIVLVSFVDGTAAAVFGAAYTGAFKAVVPTEQLAGAASAAEARRAVQRLVSPPLGGALFGLARALPFAVDALSYAFSTLSVLAMRTPFQEAREREPTRAWTEAVDGLRFVWRNPLLRLTSLMLCVGSLSELGVPLAVIVLLKRDGLSGAAVGAFVALFGASMLLGSLASPLVRRVLSPRAILLSEFWAGGALVAFLVWPSPYALAVAYAFQSFFFPNTNAAVTAYLFAATPDRLVARVSTGMTNLALLVTPLGPLLAGVLLESASPRVAIGVFVALVLGTALVGTLSRATRAADVDVAVQAG